MSSAAEAYVPVLLRQGLLSPEHLDEARHLCRQFGPRLQDALVRLGYVSATDLLRAWAAALDLTYLDLTAVVVPPRVLELLPESVARENVLLPVLVEGRTLVVAVCDPDDQNLRQKLEFILNCSVQYVLASRDQIVAAINRHYGQSETESVDSMLAEFTDTAIDFTETAAAPPPRAKLPVTRRATVRYYERMNPDRLVPLLVVLSEAQVRRVHQKHVAQAHSAAFQVAEGSVVEVEPVLPGCCCYPPKELARVTAGEVVVKFWVAARVLGRVAEARVAVRQDGRCLAEVPLEIRVVRQTMTVLMAGLSLVLPFVLLLLKHFELDFESQLKGGFGLYAQLAGWAVRSLTPELLTGLLVAVTAGLYLYLRPRRRDVFGEVRFVASEGSPAVETPASLLAQADERHAAGDAAAALNLYQRAMATEPLAAVHYFRASLAAAKTGSNLLALEILQQARLKLPANRLPGCLWFNMGCFAARLGRYQEAMNYLHYAAEAGYADPAKYLFDADLEPLRWRKDFKRLVGALAA